MKTALDSNIISAVLCLEPSSQVLIAMLGKLRLEGALVISGTVYAELHGIPGLTAKLLEEFLNDTGIAVETQITFENWAVVGQVFGAYAARRRKTGDGGGKRLLADFIVGMHASRYTDRLLTLDPKRYAQAFPKLKLVEII